MVACLFLIYLVLLPKFDLTPQWYDWAALLIVSSINFVSFAFKVYSKEDKEKTEKKSSFSTEIK
jgi:hypothetical protein